MNFNWFKKKDNNETVDFDAVDKNQKDKLQVVISRLENDTKVTIKQFFAEYLEDPETNVAYWVNEKQKFRQPVADYYLTAINQDTKDTKEELIAELKELNKTFDREKNKKTNFDPKVNLADVVHEIEVKEHQLFLMEQAVKGYSVINRNLQNYRKVEYLQIGAKLYPLGFNPKLMTYFIIPIDKDITLDKHRENVTLKHTTAFQKLIASATILMLILTIGLTVVSAIAGYKLYFAYDETHIAELERACAGSSIMNSVLYEQATNNFAQSTTDFKELVEQFKKDNLDLAEVKQIQTVGDKN